MDRTKRLYRLQSRDFMLIHNITQTFLKISTE